MAESPDLSIVIVSWNVRRLLGDCLDSIRAHRGALALEIFVVDNASLDDSAGLVRAEYPEVSLIVNDTNRGFSAANNQAIAVASGRHVLLLNPDTLWVDASLARLVAFLDAHPRVGAVGPKLLNADRVTVQDWGGRRLPRPADTLIEYSKLDVVFPRNRLCMRHLMADWDHQDSRDVECLSGACLMVRAATIREVGALDEGFPLYSEDTDWCYRIRHRGWGIHYLAEACVVHIGQQSSLQNRGPSTVKAVQGIYRYYRKSRGPLTVLTVWAGVCVVSLLKLAAWSLLRLTGKVEPRVAADQVRAVLARLQAPAAARVSPLMTTGPVLHLVPWFGRGGREQVVLDMITGLARTRPGLVATAGGPGVVDLENRQIPWVRVPLFPSTLRNAVASGLALRQIVRTRQIAVVHSHHRFSGMVGRIVAGVCRVPFVSTVHDLATGQPRLSRFGVGGTVMVFSDAVGRHVVEAFGVPSAAVHKVPMGIALDGSSPSTLTTPHVIGFFGRLEWEKGPDLFVETAARIARACPEAEFWMAGTGELESATRDLAAQRGLGDRLRFLGWVSDIEPAIRASAVIIVPSRREGFGRSVLEAMMLGKPVVATRVGAIPELIDDERTGCLAPPDDVNALADAAVALLKDPARAERIGSAARLATQESHSISAMVSAVDALYRRAITG